MLLPPGSSSSRILVLVLFLLAIFLVLSSQPFVVPRLTEWQQTSASRLNMQRPGPVSSPAPTDPEDHSCGHWPGLDGIAIAVKTGATEAVEKIPILMLTALRCAPKVKLYSDLEQEIAGHHLSDALETIPQTSMEGNADFDFYWQLKEAQQYGKIAAMLKDARNPDNPYELAAWTLDKYKSLHILEDLYAEFPDAGWYLVMDADTYLVWSNLVEWLHHISDPRQHKLYLGSLAAVGDRKFAHGGSGILISQAAMYELAVVNNGTAASWDEKMHEECCGDLIIGDVLREMDVSLSPSWPTLNGEKPSTLPFGPTHWCQPVVTMHHVQPNEMNLLANFEAGRNSSSTPTTFSDVYNAFVKHNIPNQLEDWYNHALDVHADTDSFEECKATCQADEECFQFSHHERECVLGHSIHLGEPRKSEDDIIWRSGWLRDRIESWVEAQPPCEPEFPHTR